MFAVLFQIGKHLKFLKLWAIEIWVLLGTWWGRWVIAASFIYVWLCALTNSLSVLLGKLEAARTVLVGNQETGALPLMSGENASTAIDILELINYVFPLEEGIGMLVALLSVLMACVVARFCIMLYMMLCALKA